MEDVTDRDNGNGRVTMALLAQQLKYMEQRAVERHAETMDFCEKSEKDRAVLHEANHQRELEITQLREQQSNLAKVQVVISAAMSAASGVLAGVLGR